MTRITFAIATLLSLAFTPLAAQDRATGGGEVLLLDVVATERMSLGKLDSCEITYLLAYEDYIYRNGLITLLRGSIAFAAFVSSPDAAPAIVFKVTAFDLEGEQHVLAPLKYAYLNSGGVSYAGKELGVEAAEDGGILIGYDAFANISLNPVEPISLNITREGGNSDVSIPVDFGMYDPSIIQNYGECMLQLIDVITEKLQ